MHNMARWGYVCQSGGCNLYVSGWFPTHPEDVCLRALLRSRGVSSTVKMRVRTALLPALCQLINDLLLEVATDLERGCAKAEQSCREAAENFKQANPILLMLVSGTF